MTDPTRLHPGQRAADLDRMAAETCDVAVVGTGTAFDAATRGLSVG